LQKFKNVDLRCNIPAIKKMWNFSFKKKLRIISGKFNSSNKLQSKYTWKNITQLYYIYNLWTHFGGTVFLIEQPWRRRQQRLGIFFFDQKSKPDSFLELFPKNGNWKRITKIIGRCQPKVQWRRFPAVRTPTSNLASEIIFLNDGLHIIFNRRNLEIGEHSSFFSYWQNCFLNRPRNSEIKKISKCHY